MDEDTIKTLRLYTDSTAWIKTDEDIKLYERAWQLLSRVDFFAFRRYIHGPRLKQGWFIKVLSDELQGFYEAYTRNEKPKMVVESPPQHGKSQAVVDFIAWILGKDPNLRLIYSSFSERLGKRANKAIQRMIKGNKYKAIFPDTNLSQGRDGYSSSDTFIEMVGKIGSFRNTTVGGPITGESLDIGFIDDPIKGRKDANSETVRQRTWEWFTDDFGTRFQDHSGYLIVLTRWHIDDPVGRLLKSDEGKEVKLVKYPAIATKDEAYRKEGDALFPEFKSLEFLKSQKAKMNEGSWESLYQQNPIIAGGNMFKYDWFKWTNNPPARYDYTFITADTAQKDKEQNDYSVFQAWGVWENKLFLYDMMRGKWKAPELKRRAKAFYEKHDELAREIGKMMRYMYIEDKSSGSSLIQELEQTMRIKAVQRNTDKVMRANDALIYFEQGQVYFVEGVPQIESLIDELVAFPTGTHDDTVDPLMDATEIGLNSGKFNLDAFIGG